MAWCWTGDKPLPEPMMVSLLMDICNTQPQWVKQIESDWYIYASIDLTIIGSDNDLLPVQCQAITWTNDNLLAIKQ